MCDNGDGKPAARRGLCWACIKQLQRKGTTKRTRTRHPTLRAAAQEAAIALAEADDDEAFEKAWARFRMATLRWRRTNVHKSTENSK